MDACSVALHRMTRIATLSVLLALVACSEGERGEFLYGNCVACHGEVGAGEQSFNVPSIAGLDEWYVRAQLEKFAEGHRGAHAEDVHGQRMRPMVMTLRSPEDMDAVSAYVAGLPSFDPEPTLTGDATRGAELFAPCVECHGADAAGNREKNAPPLNRADDWYLVTQLRNFREGIRGTADGDVTGGQMRPMAISLSDDQAIRDVVAHIMTL